VGEDAPTRTFDRVGGGRCLCSRLRLRCVDCHMTERFHLARLHGHANGCMPDKEREEEGEERERERAGEGGRETGVQVKGEEGAVRGKAGKIKERCVTFWCFSRCRRTMDSDDGSDVVWSAEGREGPPPSAGEESEGGEGKGG